MTDRERLNNLSRGGKLIKKIKNSRLEDSELSVFSPLAHTLPLLDIFSSFWDAFRNPSVRQVSRRQPKPTHQLQKPVPSGAYSTLRLQALQGHRTEGAPPGQSHPAGGRGTLPPSPGPGCTLHSTLLSSHFFTWPSLACSWLLRWL